MKEYKNIDRLFQEKFRDFEMAPADRMWHRIESKTARGSKRMQRSIWLWMSGIAVGLSLLFMLNNPFQIVPFKQSLSPENTQKNQTEISAIEHNTQNSNPQKENASASLEIAPSSNTSSQELILKYKPIKESEKIQIRQASESPTPSILARNNITPKKEALTSANNSLEKTDKKFNKKWTVSTMAAPIFLSSFNNSISSIDEEMNQNQKQGIISSAYGVQVAYQLNKRFSIQSGVHMVDYAYLTRDIMLSDNGVIASLTNVDYNSDVLLMKLEENAKVKVIDQAAVPDKNSIYTGNLTQVYGYIEIPIEAKYRLTTESNLGVNVIGGFSTLLLNKNEIFIESSGISDKLGSANNLNSLNFSGNFGLEFEYKVYRNVNFNLIPMFKIQTQTLNNTNAYKPYSVGLYSGLNLRF